MNVLLVLSQPFCQYFLRKEGLYLPEENQNSHIISLRELACWSNGGKMQKWFINSKVLYKTKLVLYLFTLGFWVASKSNLSQKDKLEPTSHLKRTIWLQCWCYVIIFTLGPFFFEEKYSHFITFSSYRTFFQLVCFSFLWTFKMMRLEMQNILK